jgi:hypothetical protein
MHDFHGTFSVLLHAANLRHGTDGFTSPPKEGVLRIFFSPLKIRRLRPGLNPRTWVLKDSTLPLDHRSRSHPQLVSSLRNGRIVVYWTPPKQRHVLVLKYSTCVMFSSSSTLTSVTRHRTKTFIVSVPTNRYS